MKSMSAIWAIQHVVMVTKKGEKPVSPTLTGSAKIPVPCLWVCMMYDVCREKKIKFKINDEK